MNKENIGSDIPHQGGMPSAKELEWRTDVIRAEFEAKYYPMGRESDSQKIIPSKGAISNFRMPAYDRRMAKAETAWNTRMD